VTSKTTDLASDPLLSPLWSAVHARLSRGGVTPRSMITIADASAEVRRSVDRLLGRVSSGGVLKVQLGALDAALSRAGTTAADVAVAAHGPIVDRSAQRLEAAERSQAVWGTLLQHPVAGEPPIAAWLEGIRGRGSLARSGGPEALAAALDVLGVLPADELVGRSVLAATVLGDEHGLDDDTPAGRFVTAGLAARAGLPAPSTASARAALWAAAGITLDAVSTPALTLGLRPEPCGPLTRAAAIWADGGIPLPLPAAALQAERWAVPGGTVVYVCENPSVLEAASARLGERCAPLVCVSGMPGRAVTELLGQLAGSGAELRYHGDFGSGGITIANLVVSRHRAEPWRMSPADHARALERLQRDERRPAALRGRVPEALWDTELSGAIRACGVEVSEEHVLDDLIDDLMQE